MLHYVMQYGNETTDIRERRNRGEEIEIKEELEVKEEKTEEKYFRIEPSLNNSKE